LKQAEPEKEIYVPYIAGIRLEIMKLELNLEDDEIMAKINKKAFFNNNYTKTFADQQFIKNKLRLRTAHGSRPKSTTATACAGTSLFVHDLVPSGFRFKKKRP
jgi:hypothetical protein